LEVFMKTSAHFLVVLVLGVIVTGCGGLKTFSNNILAGDTVAIGAGLKENFTYSNTVVTITLDGEVEPHTIIPAGDAAIRGIVNLYPDPLSSMIISKETDQDLTPFARTYYSTVNNSASGDKDMYQTTVFVDTPANLPPGLATITLSNGLGDSHSATVNVVGTGGSPNDFLTDVFAQSLNRDMFAAMERAPHYVVDFAGSTIPYAIQLDMPHDDVTIPDAGKIHLVNPLGDIKSMTWSATDTSTRVILMPAKGQVLTQMKDFKIYVAGGVTGLTDVGAVVEAFDIDGNPVPGVTVSITQ
jgi:hypothetical protein